jgi:hypothetical protein
VRSRLVRENVADDADHIERGLAIAREELLPPAGARERVLAELAKGRLLDTPAARAPAVRGLSKLTTSVLVGAGFVTGYWLGLHQSNDSTAGPSLQPTLSPAVSPPSSPPVPPSSPSSPPVPPSRATAMPQPESARAPAPRADATRAADAAGADASGQAVRSPVATPAPAEAAPARRARAATHSAHDELTLLSRAEHALRAGEAALALTFLDELERLHPRSTLLEERMAARLLADCLLDEPGARARAEGFLRERQGSVYADRLQSTCAFAASDADVRPINGTGAGQR